MTEMFTIALDADVAAQLRRIAAESGESVEALLGRLLEGAAAGLADEDDGSQLSEEQLADLRERLKNPGPFATDEEVDAFFARFRS